MSTDDTSLINVSFASTTTYTFLEEIGRGGMGIVYLAQRDSEGVRDQVVLKILKSRSKENTEALKREANIATGLRHENIVKTYGMESIPFSVLPREFTGDIETLSYERIRHKAKMMRRSRFVGRMGQARKLSIPKKAPKDTRRLYVMVMDYVDGTDLSALHRSHVKQKLLIPAPISAFIISRICRALEYAHEHIVHRDISPQNVLINTQGVCKLSDFGIAVGVEEHVKEIVGKIHFMSPEQLRGSKIDARSDIYSLGLVAYELLTGINYLVPPRRAPVEKQVQHVLRLMQEPILPPDRVRPDVPKALSEIVMRMIMRNPDERYPSAGRAGLEMEQKYLYASGFGPTNNALASYISIFEKNFEGYTQEQLQQLVFLKGETGKIRIKRPLTREQFTPEGLELAARRTGTSTSSALFG
jgi:serine/threonine protein kinase